MSEYNCGLVSISFRKYSPEEIVVAVKNAGLKCIEWGSDIHAPRNDMERLQKIAKLQEEYGIYCSSYGTYFRLGRDDVNELGEYTAAAKVLGTNILRLFCGKKCAKEFSMEEKKALIADCKKAAEIAEKNNVIFCLESHHDTYTETIEGALELMHEVNSPALRMYWQPNQFESDEFNLTYATLVSPYSMHLHAFNWKGEERYPLSLGKNIWKKYLECFEKNKTILLEFMPDDKLESLKNEAMALIEITK